MFGQCPAKIGSWPQRYLWTDAGGSLAGKRQDFYLPLPPLAAAPLRIEREGRKYVSQRALSLSPARCLAHRGGLRPLLT